MTSIDRRLPPGFLSDSLRADAQAGLTDYHPPEVVTRRTIIAHSAASYVLADSSKLGAIAVHRVCPLSRLTAVLTDPQAGDEVAESLAAAGCTVLKAP